MLSWKRIVRRVTIGLGLVLGACIALLLVVYLLLQTQTGRDQLAEILAWYLSSPGRREVTITRLKGTLPHSIEISGVTIRDREGEWLSLGSAIIEWRPIELLRRRLHVTRIEVSDLRLVRFSPDGSQETAPSGPGVPTLPVAITVDRFAFENVHLGESVMGVKVAFRAVGESTATEHGVVSTKVSVERTDGTPGRANVNVAFNSGTEHLGLHVEVDEPREGIIAHLLGLPGLPPVEVRLDGDGPLMAWRGQLIVRAGNLASIETEVNVRRTTMYTVIAQGRAEVARLIDIPIRRLVSEVVSYRFDVDFADREMIVLRRGRLASDAALVELAGRFVRGQAELEVALSLTARGLETVNDLLTPAAAGRIAISGTLSGPVLQPEGRLEITLTDPSTEEVTAQVLQGAFAFRPDRALGTPDLRVQVEGQGRLEGLRYVDSQVGALLGERVDWALKGQIDAKDKALDLANFKVSAFAGQAVASGKVTLADRRVDAVVSLKIDDLSRLGPAMGISPRGHLAAEVHVQSADFARGLGATITGKTRELSVGYPTLDAVLGHQVLLAAGLTMMPGGGLRVDDVEIAGANATLEGALSFTPEFHKIDSRYILRLQDLAVLSTELRTPLAGSATLEGTTQGDLSDLGFGGSLSLTKLRVGDLTFGSVNGRYKVENILKKPQGNVSFRLVDPPLGPADASADFVLAGGTQLRLNGLSIRARETHVVGDLMIPLDGPAVEGTFSGQATSLEAWAPVVGRSVSGAISFNVHLYRDGPRQAADMVLEGSHIRIGLAQIETVDLGQFKLSAQLTDLTGSPRGGVSVESEEARLGVATITSFVLTSDAASVDAVNLRARAVGDFRGPFDLDMAGGVTREGQILRLTLSRLEGRIAGRSLVLQQPAQAEYGPAFFATDNLVLDVDDGRIAGRGRIARGDISGTIELVKVPLSLMELVWPGLGLNGALDGHGRVTGPIENASGQLEVTLSDVRVTAWPGDVRPLSGTFGGDWSSGRLKVLGNIGDAGEINLEVQAEVPLRLTAAGSSLDFAIPAKEPISGRLVWRGKLEPVWELLGVDTGRVSGRADLGLNIGGTIRTPRLNGHLTVMEGEYEDFTAGTVIRKIELEIRADENRVTLTRAVGTDTGRGRLTANGVVELDRARNFPMRLALEFNNAVLVRRDELTASGSGRVTIDGTLAKAILSGRIETDTVDARIPDRSPGEVLELDVVEVNHPDAQPKGAVPQKQVEESILQLNLGLILPKRVFIRGRGLDSEWSGRLRVTGTWHAPIVEGELTPVRGEFSFAGKIFKLGEGSIRFDGTEEIDPILNLAGKYSVSDFSATVGVTGRASQPEVTLTSDPSLPQSEIASQILFGKTTGQLTPLEAAQLAEAVASLSGRGSGGQGILDVARRTLGVDVLRVSGGAEEGEGPTVTVGKYVTEKVYVGVTQGTQPGTGFTSVEVEVTPNISVESNVGQDGRSDVGVKWKWDY